MRHPFDGIIMPEQSEDPRRIDMGEGMSVGRTTGRRRFLARVFGLMAGGAALGLSRQASAQVVGQGAMTTQAVGEEGGGWSGGNWGGGGGYTTYALGEEGGGTVTTYALGEEGSQPDGWHPPQGGYYTTQALYEEGGWTPPRRRYRRGRVTTYALGEEGGQWY